MKLKHSYKRSVLFAWIFSYVLVLGISLGINVYAETRFTEKYHDQIASTSSVVLYQVKSDIDAQIDNIRTTAQIIDGNSYTTRLLNQPGSLTAADYNTLFRELRTYQSVNGIISAIYLVPDGADEVVTLSSLQRGQYKEQLLDSFVLGDGTTLQEYLTAPASYRSVFLPVTKVQSSASKSAPAGIVYVQTLPIDGTRAPRGTLLILIDSADLLYILQSPEWPDGNEAGIIDAENNVLVSSPSFSLPENLSFQALADYPSEFTTTIGGEEYTIFQSTSTVPPWKYVFLLPDATLYAGMDALNAGFLWSTLAALGLGALFILFFVRRNYSPLREIAESFGGWGPGKGTLYNEYEYVARALRDERHLHGEEKKKLETDIQTARIDFAKSILHNEVRGRDLDRKLKAMYGIGSAGCIYFVLCLRAFSAQDCVEPGEDSGMNAILGALLDEELQKEGAGFVVHMETLEASILCFEDSEGITETERILEDLEDEARQRFGIRITAVRSSGVFGAENLAWAYAQASSSLEICTTENRTGVYDAENVQKAFLLGDNTELINYSFEQEQELTKRIRKGDYAGASHLVDVLFDVNLRSLGAPVLRYFISNLVGTMVRAAGLLHVTDNPRVRASLERLFLLPAAPEAKEGILDTAALLCAVSSEGTASPREESFLAKVDDLIERYCSNANLNVQFLAAEMGLSASYLSKKYKSASGTRLLDGINMARIRKAKELLRNTDMSVVVIAEQCGFVGSNTFIRVFKKYEDVTPGRFRGME